MLTCAASPRLRRPGGARRYQLPGGKGETVCLLGPSGSGKSTLLRCINWLERPDGGQIYLNGERVGVTAGGVVMNDRELSRMRTRIGMVFQHSRCGRI